MSFSSRNEKGELFHWSHKMTMLNDGVDASWKAGEPTFKVATPAEKKDEFFVVTTIVMNGEAIAVAR